MSRGWKAAFVVACAVVITAAAITTADAFGWGKSKDGHQADFEKKFSCKTHFILEHQDELGLSEDQVAKVSELSTKTKKDVVRKDADIKVVALDIQAEMHKDPMDEKAVHDLVDKKYDLKKEKAKMLVSACADLKKILTNEQRAKMKELWKDKKKSGNMGMMKGPMNCPKMGGRQ